MVQSYAEHVVGQFLCWKDRNAAETSYLHILQIVQVLLEVPEIIPVVAGWLGVASTISRSARPVLEGWGAAGWGWNMAEQKDQGTVHT